jgi:hypothetical protein
VNKVKVKESDIEIIEMVEAISFDDVDIDDEIREWLQHAPPIQIKDYGFDEVNREEEYLAIQEELFNILMER